MLPLQSRVKSHLQHLQDSICLGLERLDGAAKFREDAWTHVTSGGGRTRVMTGGALFEKAGVNFSAVEGPMSEKLQKSMNVGPADYFATGVSLVLHPASPMVPTVHANFRYFELSTGDAWFGGGTDLTPYYLFEEDCVHFHSTLKKACDKHSKEFYPRFKKWCDEYFMVKHRDECRGIGGIFFDYLRGTPDEMEKHFAFLQSCGDAFLHSYVPIAERRRDEPFTDAEKQWQLLRRGRYVEFNLVNDRGTLFGLETKGRIESILMSLPALAAWEYNHVPAAGSREEELLKVLKQPRAWI